jgi:hypothetical protein
VLAVTETVSWGVLCYALPVLLVPMREDLGCSTAQLAGGLSLAHRRWRQNLPDDGNSRPTLPAETCQAGFAGDNPIL